MGMLWLIFGVVCPAGSQCVSACRRVAVNRRRRNGNSQQMIFPLALHIEAAQSCTVNNLHSLRNSWCASAGPS
eukprot:2763831-Heterocapsa_arctica.AAC.1